MTELVETSVRAAKGGDSVWLEGGKLLRNGWTKGDSASIDVREDRIVLSKLDEPVARSNYRIQNVSGRKHRSRDEIKPILELMLSKADLGWNNGTPLLVMITTRSICIMLNDTVARQAERMNKLKASIKSRVASQLILNDRNTPNAPSEPLSKSTDLVDVTFDLDGEADARFFNFLHTIEKSNPFAVMVRNYAAKSNTIGEGFGAVLKSIGYKLFSKNHDVVAVDNRFEALEDITSNETLSELFDVTAANIQPSFGHGYACPKVREELVTSNLLSNNVKTTSLFHGGGSLDFAEHSLFDHYGFNSEIDVLSELEDEYIAHSFDVNRHSYTDSTLILNGNMMAFNPFHLTFSSLLLTAGVSCVGSSLAGRSKLKLGSAEEHPKAGALFYPTMKFIAASNAPFVMIENTDSYRNTDSYAGFKAFFGALEYVLEDGIINSHSSGSIESRNRLFCLAADKHFHSPKLGKAFSKESDFVGARQPISTIIDLSICDSDPSYRLYEALKAKELRDSQNGKGFKRALLTGEEFKTPTIRAQYVKAGSCDSYYVCPSDNEKSRLFSKLEHCRIKGFPDSYITNSKTHGATLAHTILGQGITWHSSVRALRPLAELIYDIKEMMAFGDKLIAA